MTHNRMIFITESNMVNMDLIAICRKYVVLEGKR